MMEPKAKLMSGYLQVVRSQVKEFWIASCCLALLWEKTGKDEGGSKAIRLLLAYSGMVKLPPEAAQRVTIRSCSDMRLI